MAKVYRLHEGQEGTGWFRSNPFSAEQLSTIITDGNDIATSIPSPFARIDLVKTAFQWVANNNIEGNTANHKLVSDALDVAQLFYASENFNDLIDIYAWDPNARFETLIDNGNNNNDRHRRFAATLRLFWDQDRVYNFNHVNRLYFLVNHQNQRIIGGTSPATMFFASPDINNIAENLNIRIGGDRLFDDNYASLNQRENSFIEYIYTLSQRDSFALYFPEVYSYLERIRENHLDGELLNRVNNNNNAYETCPVDGNPDDTCEILGIQLGIQRLGREPIQQTSDFIIQSHYNPQDYNPLVIPNEIFNPPEPWTYTTENIFWDPNTEVPVSNNEEPDDSILPGQRVPYYWLSSGNFFEEYIIKLPYEIDDTKFITCGSTRYLLPLTPTFFKYFRADDVHNYLTITEQIAGTVVAELNIPVRRGNITFRKSYNDHQNNVRDLKMHLAVFPFLKRDNLVNRYTLGLLDARENREGQILLKCYDNGDEINVDAPVIRNPGEADDLSSYFQTEGPFDSLNISYNELKGFIIPRFKVCNGNANINFAIDFGTTNTHVEYKTGGNDAKAFDIQENAPLWKSLLKVNGDTGDEFIENESLFDQEILPYSISNNGDVKFPLRTALVINQADIDYNQRLNIIRQVNNYLLLERKHVPNHLDLHTEIKWSNYADHIDEQKVKSYIEFLMSLVFYKTLLLGGNPGNTKITWFYPVSMSGAELGILFGIWENVYNDVFNDAANVEANLKKLPESIGPYLFHRPENPGLSLTIDIGGGSSDIAVFQDNEQAMLISSFKFAGNAIYGDGYDRDGLRRNTDRNGFVNTFANAAQQAFVNHENKNEILTDILQNRMVSADFSSFLFACEEMDDIEWSYSRLLQRDTRLKLIHLIFYSSIAYYSAMLLNKSGIAIPQNILLSGTASKSASFIDTTDGLTVLSGMFRFIFGSVYNQENNNISIELTDKPKEVTCKGALRADLQDYTPDFPTKFWIGGMDEEEQWGSALDKNEGYNERPTYADREKVNIMETINDFYNILDNYVEDINLRDQFLIDDDAYETFRNIRGNNIPDYLERGINAFYHNDDDRIEESLFFYPLIGMLNELAYQLSNGQNNENH
jgi:hypothetical protein